jgi:hypothetical protein
MTQLQQILSTSAVTIAGAVIVFALTQFVQRFWLDPIQEYSKAVANIDITLLVYANVLGTPKAASAEARTETCRALRECAGRFLSAANTVHWWWLARLFRLVSQHRAVRVVVGDLIGLSNMGDGSDQQEPHVNARWTTEIADELGLRMRSR